jgi:hypothetical protein
MKTARSAETLRTTYKVSQPRRPWSERHVGSGNRISSDSHPCFKCQGTSRHMRQCAYDLHEYRANCQSVQKQQQNTVCSRSKKSHPQGSALQYFKRAEIDSSSHESCTVLPIQDVAHSASRGGDYKKFSFVFGGIRARCLRLLGLPHYQETLAGIVN